jgi:cell division topological specificity factor
MGLFDFLLVKKQTASVAKDRLRIIVAHERAGRGGPDYLPMLQRELLEVIRKYVNVDIEAVKVDLIGDGDNKVLDISVALPEKAQSDPRAAVVNG